MIKVLNINQFFKEVDHAGPITTSQLFLSKTVATPHPNGLYSEELFGISGSKEQANTYSWIELNTHVIHPVIYDILTKRIERKITSLLSGDISFSLDDNGILREDPNGNITGMNSLYEHRHELRFRRGEDEEGDRNKIIDMIEYNLATENFFIDKLLVIPPFYRQYSAMESGEIAVSEITKLYSRVVMLSNQLKAISGILNDILSYQMQNLLLNLLELIRTKISKKEGLIRSFMLGKRVDFSARAVISPNPNLNIGEVGVPFRIITQIFEPNLLYGLANSPYANQIPEEFHLEVKKFLGKEKALDID